jgi:hypothetical protein
MRKTNASGTETVKIGSTEMTKGRRSTDIQPSRIRASKAV